VRIDGGRQAMDAVRLCARRRVRERPGVVEPEAVPGAGRQAGDASGKEALVGSFRGS
jgi:hypothetical protein